ncbi:hypothetical protein CYMTET_52300 [Cymbomonas tetramitiformis]|uniref:Uncharacterized protein n=1 Tax=Cymbomonas tetramitiformis TaxID=36881 RepID=A0AAE0ESW0_9CHLO|nr:hypothetical protein CYMTET_52300 [Cymbomonas tetramitiformis]|eukprot:gene9515-11275_t
MDSSNARVVIKGGNAKLVENALKEQLENCVTLHHLRHLDRCHLTKYVFDLNGTLPLRVAVFDFATCYIAQHTALKRITAPTDLNAVFWECAMDGACMCALRVLQLLQQQMSTLLPERFTGKILRTMCNTLHAHDNRSAESDARIEHARLMMYEFIAKNVFIDETRYSRQIHDGIHTRLFREQCVVHLHVFADIIAATPCATTRVWMQQALDRGDRVLREYVEHVRSKCECAADQDRPPRSPYNVCLKRGYPVYYYCANDSNLPCMTVHAMATIVHGFTPIANCEYNRTVWSIWNFWIRPDFQEIPLILCENNYDQVDLHY